MVLFVILRVEVLSNVVGMENRFNIEELKGLFSIVLRWRSNLA